MNICVCVVIAHISLSLFTAVLSHIVFLFVIDSVVDMLWEHRACHLLRQDFFPLSSFYSFFLPSHPDFSSRPLGMQTRCSWWFLLWAEVFCDFWFWLSAASDEGAAIPPEAWQPCLGMMRATICREDWHFSVILIDTQTPDVLFIFSNLALLFSPLILPVLFAPRPPLFSVKYTFKHEICLIRCEVSQ